MKSYEISRDGFKKLLQRREELRKQLDKAWRKVGDEAQRYPDLPESSAYHWARHEHNRIQAMLDDVNEQITLARVIEKDPNTKQVSLGSTVTVCINGKEKTYVIVGELESNPSTNKISQTSPLGTALIGKTMGSDFQLITPTGVLQGQVLKIQ